MKRMEKNVYVCPMTRWMAAEGLAVMLEIGSGVIDPGDSEAKEAPFNQEEEGGFCGYSVWED